MRRYVVAALSIAIAIGPAAAVAGSVGIGASSGSRPGGHVSDWREFRGNSRSIGRHRQRRCKRESAAASAVQAPGCQQARQSGMAARRRRNGRSIGRHRQRLSRRKHWSQRRRGNRRAVGRQWRAPRPPEPQQAPFRRQSRSSRCLTLNGSSTAATTARRAPVDGVRQSITLPLILLPSGRSDRASAATTFDEIPGTPAAVVRACRDAVESAATPFGVVSVRARSAGSLRRLSRGAISAPVQVRIYYARQGGAEIRQARIRCHLDASGKVIKLT